MESLTIDLSPKGLPSISEDMWQPFRKNVDIYPLDGNPPQGQSTALIRYQPGARIPNHKHLGTEHIFVLSGSQNDENGHYSEGNLLISSTGSEHSIISKEGCIVLAIYSGGVVVKEP
tara:strand:- start:105 stop:455 length:351 start_codon:yes stop_codon:yes gene_type:complete